MANDPENEKGQSSNKFKQARKDFDKITKLKKNLSNSENINENEDENFEFYLYRKMTEEKDRSESLQTQLKDMKSEIKALSQNVQELTKLIDSLQREKDELKTLLKAEEIKNQSVPSNRQFAAIKRFGKNDATNTNEEEKSNVTQTSPTVTNKQSKMNNKIPDNAHQKPSARVEKNTPSDNINELEEDAEEFTENEKRKRTNNITPVDVWTATQDATQQIIRNQLPPFSCTFSKINKTKMRVFAKTNDIRSKLISLLKERNINFNTYTPTDEKMQNVLLKGTEIDNVDVIEEALSKNGIQPHKIQRFETGYMRKMKMKSNIWQIILLPKTDLKSVQEIKYVAEWSVKWEIMRKPAIIQCKRCQRLNHSASNCTLPYRCVKCTTNHKPGECPNGNKQNKTKPKCVNCDGEHTANNATQCPMFKKELQIREEKKQQKNVKKTGNVANKPPAVVRSDNKPSYANVLKSTTNKVPSTKTNNVIQMITESQNSMREMFQAMIDTQNKLFEAIINQNGK